MIDLDTFNIWNAPNRAGLSTVTARELIDTVLAEMLGTMSKRDQVVGENQDLTTAGVPEDVWRGADIIPQNLYIFPAGQEVLDIVSSSVNDAAAGIGARTLLIEGLSTTFAPVVETIALNGTTIVTTANQYFRINNVFVETAGTDEQNDGDITIRQQTSGIFIAILAKGDNRALQAIWTVPASWTNGAVVVDTGLSVGKQSAVDVKVGLLVRPPGTGTVFIPTNLANFNTQGNGVLGGVNVAFPILDIGTDVKAQVLEVSANATSANASMNFTEPSVDL